MDKTKTIRVLCEFNENFLDGQVCIFRISYIKPLQDLISYDEYTDGVRTVWMEKVPRSKISISEVSHPAAFEHCSALLNEDSFDEFKKYVLLDTRNKFEFVIVKKAIEYEND